MCQDFPETLEDVSIPTSQVELVVKNLSVNAEDIRNTGLIPGLGRSPGEGMVTHSSILSWRTPLTEKLGRLWSIGLHIVRHG